MGTRTQLADRLTGLSRIAAPHLLGTLALAVGACVVLAAYGTVSGSGAWWFVPQAKDLFDPADRGERGLTYVVLLPCGVAIMLGVWTPWARLLKVLPISARHINALLLLTPFATWTILWLVGVSVYWMAHGSLPRTLRVDFAFGMAGIGALVHAGLLRFQGSTGSAWVLAATGGLVPPFVQLGVREDSSHMAFAVIGAVAACVAAFVNHRTLTRSTSSSMPYRKSVPPFGLRKPSVN